MNYPSRNLSGLLNNLRKIEENSISGTSFVGSMAKAYKYGLLMVSIIGIGMGYILVAHIQNYPAGSMFVIIGIIALLLLPTYFSYRCYVDNNTINEKYYILCFKISNKALWKDVKYKQVKRDANGNAYTIKLYNINKKKLIRISNEVVGFEKIVKIAKGIPKLNR